MIELKKTQHDGYCTYKVYWDNGKYLGDFEPMDDGYLAYWPSDKGGGAFTQHLLHQLYLELDKLNAGWNEKLEEGLKESNKRLEEAGFLHPDEHPLDVDDDGQQYFIRSSHNTLDG